MAATSTITNRVSAYYTQPAESRSNKYVQLPAPQPVPETPHARKQCAVDAFYAAIQLLQTHLHHPDPDVSGKAARALVNVQLTQLRHGGQLLGTKDGPQDLPFDPLDQNEDTFRGNPTDVPQPTDAMRLEWKLAIAKIQKQLQAKADADGFGEQISWKQARAVHAKLEKKGENRARNEVGQLETPAAPCRFKRVESEKS
jgi:hypothetical protein